MAELNAEFGIPGRFFVTRENGMKIYPELQINQLSVGRELAQSQPQANSQQYHQTWQLGQDRVFMGESLNLLVAADWRPFEGTDILINYADQGTVDAVISLGNLSPNFYEDAARFFPDTPKLAVLGNLDDPSMLQILEQTRFHHLHMAQTEIRGIIFAGFSGGTCDEKGDGLKWAQNKAMQRIEALPPSDILISHSPPYRLCRPEFGPEYQGLQALDWYIEHHHPRLTLCGHPHLSLTRHFNDAKVHFICKIQWVSQIGVIYERP